MTEKEQVKAYINLETKRKFEIITAIKGKKSMSKYAGELIQKCIEEYEAQHGAIQIDADQESQGGR